MAKSKINLLCIVCMKVSLISRIELTNTKKGGVDIYTEQEFGDCIVELEVMIPKGSNSGIYLMGQYEVQIVDSYGKKSNKDSAMGAVAYRNIRISVPGQ